MPANASPAERTHALSSAPRPQIAADLAAAAAACQAVVAHLAGGADADVATVTGTGASFTESDAVAAVCTSLKTRSTGTCRSITVTALSAAAYAWNNQLLTDALAEFARAVGNPQPSGSDLQMLSAPEGQLLALRRLGLNVTDVSPASLAPHRRRVAVRALEAVHSAQSRARWIADGGLVATATSAYDAAVAPGDLDLTIDALVAAGLDGERLVNAVIQHASLGHVLLVWHEVKKLKRSFSDREAEDMFGYGWRGLYMALRKYDPTRNNAFSTYACTRINGAIRDGVRSENPIPKRLTTFVRKVSKAEEDLTQALGRAPELRELAAHLGEEESVLRSMLPRLSPAASLEELANPTGERGSTLAFLVDLSDPAADAQAAMLRRDISGALAALPEDEAVAVRLLVMEGLSPAEASEITGANTRQLRARLRRGLSQLEPVLAGWVDDPAV